jgi:hypothetical protein
MILLTFTQINSNILFTYLYQLKAYRKNIKLNFIEILHLDKLIEFLITYYALTSKKLTVFFKHKKITFKLLLIFFRPNFVVYIVFTDFEKPKCLIFNSGLIKAFNNKKIFRAKLPLSYLRR